ncbi:hypothetical protein DFO66_101227 [Brevibacterium sanguinis]|uniref:Cobalamin-independent methionine synthase catalytic subunit n=2 Tax=Brevibacterium TaxID=1696 RepID=A0A366IRH2_9MICO|nr:MULTISPECIES: hypothetical protein [Brevibacterium]RBP68003.1 hypothetical protein DFO66_101227 [Brevibacterium sanguinis]RBP74580.1 hypothetical protein DFO65_101302 [Brevibacterium celere]
MSTSSGSPGPTTGPEHTVPGPERTVPAAASTTGIWIPQSGPGTAAVGPRGADSPRPALEAARTGVDVLGEHQPPLPLVAHRSAERWGADAVGRGLGLLRDLHVDRTSFGWRLTSTGGRDERLEASALGEALDALAESAAGFTGEVQVSLPGPWTLVTALSLTSGAPVLGDHGARRDVVQAYAFGIADLAERIADTGMRPVVRLVESRLTPVLTGTWPTASGLRTLPAIAETQVYAALRSTLSHLPPVLLSLPDLDPLRLRGKEIPAAEVVRAIGAASVSVPWATLRASGWEQLATLAEAGVGIWVHLPVAAGSSPGEVTRWRARLVEPWTRIGMGARTLREFGVLAGEELPLSHPPFLPVAGSAPDRPGVVSGAGAASGAGTGAGISRGHMMIAAGLRRALEEIE